MRDTSRRELRFATLADLRRDVDALEAAERAGTLRATGAWTPGQVFAHLGNWIDYAYDGFPRNMPIPPWPLRVLIRLMRGSLLTKPMRPGFRFRSIPEGTFGNDKVSPAQGLRTLRGALARLEMNAPRLPSPALGTLTHEQWKQLHLRHAELHLGFLHPE